jgi:hypothetical protein
MVQLRVGFSTDISTFQRVAIGTVYGIRRSGAQWTLTVRDLLGSLASRFVSDPAEAAIFWDQGLTSVSVGPPGPPGYVAGDTFFPLTDVSLIRRSPTGLYCIKVTGDSGEEFYLVAPTKGVNGLTNCTITGQFGTIAEDAGPGNQVLEVLYYDAHPLDVARQVLVCTGTGSNGKHDKGDIESAGLAIPEDLIAHDDIAYWITQSQPVVAPFNTDFWQLVIDEPVSNPKAMLDAWLTGGGFFLGNHQGNITARCAVVPAGQVTPGRVDIDHSNIATFDSYDAYDPQNPVEYEEVAVQSVAGSVNTTVSTKVVNLPSQPLKTYIGLGIYGTIAGRTVEVRDRISKWATETPEIIQVNCAGWSAGICSAGDVVPFTTDVITDRTGLEYNEREVLVVAAQPDWFSADCILVMAVLVEE